MLVDDLLGTNAIADEVRCSGHTDEAGVEELADYLIYAFGVARRLDQLGIGAAWVQSSVSGYSMTMQLGAGWRAR